MPKISYINKQPAVNPKAPQFPIEIFSSSDANEIKNSVNDLYDIVSGGTYTFLNGLSQSESNVELGGTFDRVSNPIEIASNDTVLSLLLSENIIKLSTVYNQHQSSIKTDGINIGNNTFIAYTQLSAINSENGTKERKIRLGSHDSDQITITDSIGNSGMHYASDYSANYGDRTLVDKQYVDSLVEGAMSVIGTGLAMYKDNLYTTTSALTINSGISTVLTNNAATILDSQLPVGVTSFYDNITNKITPQLNGDSYLINVRFKARNNNINGLLDIVLDIGGTLNIINAETVSLRKGIGIEQQVNILFDVYCAETFISNGGLIKAHSIVGNTEIYDIQYKITRTHKAKQ